MGATAQQLRAMHTSSGAARAAQAAQAGGAALPPNARTRSEGSIQHPSGGCSSRYGAQAAHSERT